MINCPNCGAQISDGLATAAMAVCENCQSTVYRVDDRLLTAGSAGEMHQSPLLIGLGDSLKIGGTWRQAVGHARFSYGPGWWDEFWVEDDTGGGLWVSFDEGDIVAQSPVAPSGSPRASRFHLGAELRHGGEDFVVTEIGSGDCIALRGVFPERLAVGDRFDYVNFSSHTGKLLSAESHAGETDWFLGTWLDPFALEIRR